jgi:hypothetical protein
LHFSRAIAISSCIRNTAFVRYSDFDEKFSLTASSEGVTIRYAISKGGTLMDEKTICITEKVIGDTLYIIESAVSSAAKETAYDKLKRMILNDIKSLEMKAS